jgi:hypothetical protein
MNISTSDALELRRQEYQKFNAGCFSVFIPFIFLLIMGCQEQKKPTNNGAEWYEEYDSATGVRTGGWRGGWADSIRNEIGDTMGGSFRTAKVRIIVMSDTLLWVDKVMEGERNAFWLSDSPPAVRGHFTFDKSGLLPLHPKNKKKKQKTKYDHDWGTPVGSGDVIGYNYDGTIDTLIFFGGTGPDTVNNYMMPMPTYPDSFPHRCFSSINRHYNPDTTYLCGCESRLYRDSVLKSRKQ